LGTAGLNEDGQQMQQLADACVVIDALDPSAKEELIRNVCSKELTAYQQIFQGTGAFFYLCSPELCLTSLVYAFLCSFR
jgi:hypothetical protein